MSLKQMLLILTLLVSPGFGEAANTTCSDLSSIERDRVASYIIHRFYLPQGTPLTIEVDGAGMKVDEHLLLHIRSGTRRVHFNYDVYISCDHRFLTPIVFDSMAGPNEERTRVRQAVERSIASGVHARKGAAEAKVRITVFSDFECPYCREAARQLEAAYAKLGPTDTEIRYRYLPSLSHHWAFAGAEAAACAQIQGNEVFWRAHDLLFERQGPFSDAAALRTSMVSTLKGLPKFDAQAFERCVDRHEAQHVVDSDIALAVANRVFATPTIFVNGYRVDGVVSADRIQAAARELNGE